MKVLVVLYNDIHIDTRVQNEIDYLVREGIRVHIIHTGSKADYLTSEPLISSVSFSSNKTIEKFMFASQTTLPFFDRVWSKRVLNEVKSFAPDVIHAHDLYMGPACLKASSGTPVVLDLHENYPYAFSYYSWTNSFPRSLLVNKKYWFSKEGEVLRSVDGIITLSSQFRDDLKDKHGLTSIKSTVYPNVPDLKKFESHKEFQHPLLEGSSAYKVFYFGMINEARGLEITSQAIKALCTKGYDIQLVIAGRVNKTYLPKFENEVLGDHVIHIPWIELNQLESVVNQIDLCISPIDQNPQHESGVANKVFQYMLLGKPLLVSNCGPQEDLVKETNCGKSFVHNDISDLESKLLWFYENQETGSIMGTNGHQSIINEYNTDMLGENITKLYLKLVPSK